ncbi:hypothetical protein MCNF_39070 [Mycolicibacterium confluentis]|uniref:Secreted protein n=1 Tax=Mycolicibacterium confluentis TaxID=28047 RepID=A0A7I7Y2P0_9MYCO|nr:hypothetical protein MCNF_39070 [Mycolicibacterium confluentis]
MNQVLSIVRTAAVAAVAAGALALPATAAADPAAPPTIPNVNSFPPVSPVEYSVLGDRYYAFGTPDGLICAFDRINGSYGCSGPIPAAPGGANVVSAGPAGAPAFTSSDRPIFGAFGDVKQLPPNTRMSFRTVSCTNDGAATTICVNSQDQTGFVLSPAGSFLLEVNPLLYRPEGTNPYAN